MKIDTDDWIELSEALKHLTMSPRAGRRLAADLGITVAFFGVLCIRREHIETMNSHRRRVGNQDWIESSELAAEAAEKATASRMRRVARKGLTAAERRRNKHLASGKAGVGQKMPRP